MWTFLGVVLLEWAIFGLSAECGACAETEPTESSCLFRDQSRSDGRPAVRPRSPGPIAPSRAFSPLRSPVHPCCSHCRACHRASHASAAAEDAVSPCVVIRCLASCEHWFTRQISEQHNTPKPMMQSSHRNIILPLFSSPQRAHRVRTADSL
ncbi:hypothetical protein BC830DRAFT_238505 [Chytriomyces sp. MP71]|nr:hypothetical protein BC830DRAFT_238505 [Chytriomyces sp. MP71]